MKTLNIKTLINSDIKSILQKYYSKSILYRFLIFVVKDTMLNYAHSKYKKIYAKQNKVLEILGDLLLGKVVLKKDIEAAFVAAFAAAHATSASHAANSAAYAANSAAYATANAATSASHAATIAATIAAHVAKQQEYKQYLIKLVLEDNKIDCKAFSILYGNKII